MVPSDVLDRLEVIVADESANIAGESPIDRRPNPEVPHLDVTQDDVLPRTPSSAITGGGVRGAIPADDVLRPSVGASETVTALGCGGSNAPHDSVHGQDGMGAFAYRRPVLIDPSLAASPRTHTSIQGPQNNTGRSCGPSNAEVTVSENAKKRQQYRAIPRTSRPRYHAPAKVCQMINLSVEQVRFKYYSAISRPFSVSIRLPTLFIPLGRILDTLLR